MSLPSSYATADDLAGYWRPLTDAEQTRATVLLGAAADRINELPNADKFVQTACKWVSLDMVKRAMLAPSGVSEMSESMAGMSANFTYINPAGDLYITPKEVDRLKGRYGPSAFSLIQTSNARVPLEPWNYQQSSQTEPVTGITLSPESMSLVVGGSQQLMVFAAGGLYWQFGYPTNTEYEDRTAESRFSTSDPTIATVSDSGEVTGIAAGTATISASYEGFTAECAVTVA